MLIRCDIHAINFEHLTFFSFLFFYSFESSRFWVLFIVQFGTEIELDLVMCKEPVTIYLV
jgi:hypothetical protein